MSEEREREVTDVIMKWITDWTLPLNDERSRDEYLANFDPNIVWTDHAFHVQRKGYEALLGLHKAFNHCNQPFETKVKAIHHTSTGAILEAVWVGRCVNDIVRPDGQVAVKAHGKDFICHVCFVLEIDGHPRITRIDEYYNKVWEDGVAEDQYARMGGASMK